MNLVEIQEDRNKIKREKPRRMLYQDKMKRDYEIEDSGLHEMPEIVQYSGDSRAGKMVAGLVNAVNSVKREAIMTMAGLKGYDDILHKDGFSEVRWVLKPGDNDTYRVLSVGGNLNGLSALIGDDFGNVDGASHLVEQIKLKKCVDEEIRRAKEDKVDYHALAERHNYRGVA